MNPVTPKKFISLLYYQKYLGFFLIVIGIPIFIFLPTDNTRVIGPEWPLLIGLYTVFFSREKIEDERSTTIRSASLMIAFVSGYVIELISKYFYFHGFTDWHLAQISHFIILVLATAIIIFNWMLHSRKG